MPYKKEIQKFLREIGINNTYLGYYYVTYAIQLVIDDETKLILISKWLYPDVAIKFHTSVSCVERNIRTVIQTIWEHGNLELLETAAGCKLRDKPTNSEFISIIASYIRSLYESL